MSAHAAPDAVARPLAEPASFYRYRDASGRSVIVDSLARVPASQRASVEVIALSAGAETNAPGAPDEPSVTGAVQASTRELHLPSFIAGASCALLCVLLVVSFQRKLGRWLRGALVLGTVGLLALGATAYFGWLRRSTGQSDELLASPARLIDDARAQVEKMNRRNQEQQRALRELEQVR